MTANALQPGRLEELLAGEAAGDLNPEEAAALGGILERSSPAGRDDFLAAAGLAQVCFLKADRRGLERMPAGLEAKLKSQAAAWSAKPAQSGEVADIDAARGARAARSTARPAARPRRRWFGAAATGWYAAAALAIAFVVLRTDAPMTRAPITAEDQRAALIRNAGDVITAPWSKPDESGYEGVTGDVVWSGTRQEGYLRLAGLRVNDPQRNQYQLWIVDPERDTHPVDGGIFNVTGAGEVTIPIQAKLAVGRPTAFAITLEQPGGVVVSDGPLLIVAAVGG